MFPKVIKYILLVLVVILSQVQILSAQCIPPILSSALNQTLCSNVYGGLILSAELNSPPIANFNIVSKQIQTGLTEFASNTAVPAYGVTAAYLASNLFENKTNFPLTITYSVEPVSTLGCIGTARDIIITVNPEPVIITSTYLLAVDFL
jgi:hypothetical protein